MSSISLYIRSTFSILPKFSQNENKLKVTFNPFNAEEKFDKKDPINGYMLIGHVKSDLSVCTKLSVGYSDITWHKAEVNKEVSDLSSFKYVVLSIERV